VSVKFADKPCSERMAIVQSCQVQMIKNLEVVGAFSSKKFFPEKIIFDDLPQTPPQKKFRSVYHFGDPKFFGTYQNFSRHNTNFPDITK
jgi:hypothetical protein